ncbi:MAG: N-acyl homoserine lactonase family protein [Nakamurella sp.]
MYFVQFGAERVPKSLSLAGGSHQLYWEPLMGALVETDDGWVLLDTGMSRAAHESPEIIAAYRGDGEEADNHDAAWHLAPEPPDAAGWNWILDGDPVVTALAAYGLKPADLTMAAVSHLHVDHSGGIPTLARAGVPIAIQGNELEFARGGAVGAAEGFHQPDWTEPGTRWQELDGDTRLAPGISVISTPGHTPGHMSFRVDLEDSGSWILAGDTADLAQNLLDRTPCGSYAGGTPIDEQHARTSLDRLLDIARRDGARLIPMHDQIMATAVRHPSRGHR